MRLIINAFIATVINSMCVDSPPSIDIIQEGGIFSLTNKGIVLEAKDVVNDYALF